MERVRLWSSLPRARMESLSQEVPKHVAVALGDSLVLNMVVMPG